MLTYPSEHKCSFLLSTHSRSMCEMCTYVRWAVLVCVLNLCVGAHTGECKSNVDVRQQPGSRLRVKKVSCGASVWLEQGGWAHVIRPCVYMHVKRPVCMCPPHSLLPSDGVNLGVVWSKYSTESRSESAQAAGSVSAPGLPCQTPKSISWTWKDSGDYTWYKF